MNELANDVRNKATATSVAPKNETSLKVNLLKTGPFAKQIKQVSAWFMLIIVVISLELIPRIAKRSLNNNPNC